ncbi:MAG: hypothetical protein Q4G68_03850 [Planctomycetia bacterium]|nr:hypothetical protein [Planctomycetia bacterium]
MKHAYTLLELLLALSLMIIVLSLVWMLMRLYSSDYIVAENKVARSQLTRSLARLLDDDLAATIGDPIHPLLAEETTESGLIRRFGIRGGRDWLTIDVVAPNLLAEVEDATPVATSVASDAELTSEAPRTPREKQVPELKTVFYRFVAPGARSGKADDATATDGSEMVGSLQMLPGMSREEPLVQYYGLSRRELDFETPESSGDTQPTGVEALTLIGSLGTETPVLAGNEREEEPMSEGPATAEEVAMDRESGADWAPEVVDCAFRYYDGSAWRDSWDSIKENAPPLAVSVTLVLLPLDQVNQLRTSPEYLALCGSRTEVDEGSDLGSRVSGDVRQESRPSLESIADSLGLAKPVRREIISRLATTPLSRHTLLERRRPLGGTRYDRPDEYGERRWQATPPAPDQERELSDRQWDARDAHESSFEARAFDDRTVRERAQPAARQDPLFEAIESVQAQFEEGIPTLEPATEPVPVARPATSGTHQQQSWIRNPH